MKKNKEMPANANLKNDHTLDLSEEKTSKILDNNVNEDLGTMKIGKAHSMDDDNVLIKIEEKISNSGKFGD